MLRELDFLYFLHNQNNPKECWRKIFTTKTLHKKYLMGAIGKKKQINLKNKLSSKTWSIRWLSRCGYRAIFDLTARFTNKPLTHTSCPDHFFSCSFSLRSKMETFQSYWKVKNIFLSGFIFQLPRWLIKYYRVWDLNLNKATSSQTLQTCSDPLMIGYETIEAYI